MIQDRKKYLKSPLVTSTRVSVLTFPDVSSVTFLNIPWVPALVSASYEGRLQSGDHPQYSQRYYVLTQPRQPTAGSSLKVLSRAVGWALSEHVYDLASNSNSYVNGMSWVSFHRFTLVSLQSYHEI